MTSKYAIQMSVPAGFPDLLKDFTREVLREVSEGRCKADEEAILSFAAQYFADKSLQAGTTLTPEMLQQMAEKLFIAADQNGNGRLDIDEITQIIASLASDLQLNRPGDVEYVTAQAEESPKRVGRAARVREPRGRGARPHCACAAAFGLMAFVVRPMTWPAVFL